MTQELIKEANRLFDEMLVANEGRCLKCSKYDAVGENRLQNTNWNPYLCSSCNTRAIEIAENDDEIIIVSINRPKSMIGEAA